MKYLLQICLMMMLSSITLQAQDKVEDAPLKKKKISYSSGIEASILQFARISSTLKTVGLKTIPRYTYFFNTGVDLNYHATNSLHPFTGLHIKNLGMIYQYDDSIKHKYRVYTLGAPLGIKWYTKNKKLMVKAGVDAALAFNFKWKHFLNDKKVFKSNEFFSDKTNLLFTSVFAGFSYSGFAVSGNFYLNEFFSNKNWGSVNNAQLITVSFGLNLDENTLKMKKSPVASSAK